MGADPIPATSPVGAGTATPAWLQALTGATQAAGGIVQGRYATQAEQARANQQQAIAAAEQARADQMRSQALMSSSISNMGQHSGLVVTLGVAAAAAVALAFFLKRK